MIEINYHRDITLRNDYLCSSNCTDITLRNKDICANCNKTSGSSVQYDNKSENHWLNKVTSEIDVLVLNCGVWYNQVKMDANFEYAFNELLMLIGPTIENLISSGIIVVWISLPFRGDFNFNGNRNQFGWE